MAGSWHLAARSRCRAAGRYAAGQGGARLARGRARGVGRLGGTHLATCGRHQDFEAPGARAAASVEPP